MLDGSTISTVNETIERGMAVQAQRQRQLSHSVSPVLLAAAHVGTRSGRSSDRW
jgi:hypothetical protein